MKTLVTTLTVTALLFALLPAAFMGAGAADSAGGSAPVKFGMDAGSIAAQTGAGVKPDYGTFWIGPWTLSSGWGGPDGQMASMVAQGVTPAIHFYYWGDDISPTCVENGCWSTLHNAQLDRAHWQTLAQQLVDHLNAQMQGKPAMVFVESEFNKGGISTYEPFDGYMADMMAFLHAGYPAAITVLAYGNWGSANWGTFDRAAAASDMTGLQGMRGSTHDPLSSYMGLYNATLSGVRTLQGLFHKPVILTDIALSSYPEPSYLQPQADSLGNFFTGMQALKDAGVQAMIYRSWSDSPNMSTANYYGEAERHWGIAYTASSAKPATAVWVDGVKSQRVAAPPPSSTPSPTATPPTPTPPPPTTTAPPPPPPIQVPPSSVSTEADAFATRTAGGAQTDAAASGAKMWDLWSNGYVEQAYNVTGAYDLTVRARGTPLSGVAPHMVVSFGAAQLLAADPASSYGNFTARVAGTGIAAVRIAFTNDAKSSTEDRNLILDTLRLAPANDPPVAAFTTSANGLAFAFDASTSSDAQGTALSFTWDFGDGAQAVGTTSSHVYAAAGTFVVRLTASDGSLTNVASSTVVAIQPNRAPTAALKLSANGLSVTANASGSSDPDGDALAFAMSFGDGATSTSRIATHTYAAAGTYTVVATVSDGHLGASVRQNVTVVQPNRPPSPSFVASVSGLALHVDASASSDPDANLLSYTWTFGDGTTAIGVKADHTFAKSGTFTVTLAVNDGKLTSQLAKAITLAQPAFVVTFSPKAVGNDWWIETSATANRVLAKVQTSLNGGAWTSLPKTSWGTYAASLHAPNGTHVQFRAVSVDGAIATSSSYTWT